MSAGAPGSAAQRSSMRLRATDRVRKRFEFRRVRDVGRRVHTKSFLLLVSAHGEGQPSRLGITVTKQVAGAVGRNRIKRLVREVFRQNRALFPEAADIVVVAKRTSSVQSYGDVRNEMIAASAALRTAAGRTPAARSPRLTQRSGRAGDVS
jgi:ribonuclease P protein component